MIRVITLIVAILLAIPGEARSAGDFFATAPDRVVKLIPQSTRLDMVDYFNYGSTRPSQNAFGGNTRITALSDATVDFIVDEGVSMQIAVIPTKSDTIIAVVTTLYMPVADSSIKYFDKDWAELRSAPFTMPYYDDWLTSDARTRLDEIKMHLPFIPVKAEFSQDATGLILTNGAEEYLGKEQYKEYAPFLVPAKTFIISSGRFTNQK